MPGGFGAMSEKFETLALIQDCKVRNGTIGAEDLDLIRWTGTSGKKGVE